VELIKANSFVNHNSLAPTRLASRGMSGYVMGVFSHGTPSSMPFEFLKLSIVM
jgi:hypothetical protein